MSGPAPSAANPIDPSASPRVLVADDDRTNRVILRKILGDVGYTVTAVNDGRQAVDAFSEERPDLVLMDIMMPVMNGFEATRQIKAQTAEHYVPVVFLTGSTDEEYINECVASGGDDFLTKPYNISILKAKLKAMLRLGALHRQVAEQGKSLGLYQAQQSREFEVAERLFANIVHPGCLVGDDIRYLHSAMSVFNGDLLLATRTPDKKLRVLVGDFTGHGLSAAIGAIPAADIFYGMTAKGFSMRDLIIEINRKLRVMLPTGRFFAAAMMEFDVHGRYVTVWNGGLPEILVFRPGVGLLLRLPSRHLPLGAIDQIEVDTELETVNVAPGDLLYAYSDGVLEATDPAGKMFGSRRLEGCLSTHREQAGVFDVIVQRLSRFRAGGEQSDDTTLVEIPVYSTPVSPPHHSSSERVGKPSRNWEVSINLGADTLKEVDPLPLLAQTLKEYQGLESHWDSIYTVLAELFSNALEHGLLRLDSNLKSSAEGFGRYYELRCQRLAELSEGHVIISMRNVPSEDGGRLHIRFEDSGDGFEYGSESRGGKLGGKLFHGRGLALIRQIAVDLQYFGCGNTVEVVYPWKT